MKTAITLILAAMTATSAQAWGDREQGILAGVVATIILQNAHRDQTRRDPAPVVIREPVIVREQRAPSVIIVESPQIQCPPGLAAFYIQRFDRYGRPFYVFDGCR